VCVRERERERKAHHSVAVCCSVLQRVLQCDAVCCSVLQCVAAGCRVWCMLPSIEDILLPR